MTHNNEPANTWTDEQDGSEQVSSSYIRYMPCYVYDFTSQVEVGDGKFYFYITPQMDGMNLVFARAHLIVAGSGGGPMLIQLRNVTKAQDLLATRLNIDDGDTHSDDAVIAYDVDEAADNVSDLDQIAVDIDQIHSTPGTGLIVIAGFKEP